MKEALREQNTKPRRGRTAVLCCAAVLFLAVFACLLYVRDYYPADDAAWETLRAPAASVTVTDRGGRLVFLPERPEAGLIFYPGGKVQAEAYAPLMEACAERGVLCVLMRMPGNLAVLDPNAADGIAAEYPEVTNWYLGGHSLGGAMAASYAAKNAEDYTGLVLLAAYSTEDLSSSGLRVLSVVGTEDGVLNREKYEQYRENLPADARELVIEGGCHAYFGCYGAQRGDGVPTVGNLEQIERTADAVAALALGERAPAGQNAA